MTIKAKVIADSMANGVRLTTLQLKYPRFIHSQVMTHRMFSRNASSSRAIPVEKMIKEIETDPAMPVHWGKNKAGMQSNEECDNEVGLYSKYDAWKDASMDAIHNATLFNDAGYHKQITNRITEPFQHINVIVTATEWDNFFKLRLHDDAQPEIRELAIRMREAMNESDPVELSSGEWHLPYVDIAKVRSDEIDTAIKCSVARCARLSYLNHDQSDPDVDKDIALADKLLEAGHMSPFEHQATPMASPNYIGECGEEGITHTDRKGNFWSGNFRGWLQHRQLLCV